MYWLLVSAHVATAEHREEVRAAPVDGRALLLAIYFLP
jgi:hypothetical protein